MKYQVTSQHPIWNYFLWFILGLTAIRVAFLLMTPFDLFVDEAQYWLWSTQPDWGYYSKPPMISWLIWATTHLFGIETWSIRLASPLCHLVTAGTLYLLAQRLCDRQTGMWAAITYLTIPAITLSSTIISTDPPLLLFWTCALYAFYEASHRTSWVWWAVMGVFLGLGSLTKYHMILFYPACVLYFFLSPQFTKKQFGYLIAGITMAGAMNAIIYLPNLLWNAAHHFVSYVHTKDISKLHEALFHFDHGLTFFGAQFVVFGPILGIMLLMASFFSLRARDDRTAFFFSFTLVFLGAILALSFISNAKANWAAPAYAMGTIWVVHTALSKGWNRWLRFSLMLHLCLAVGFYTYLISAKTTFQHPVIYKPLERVQGWENLGDAVSQHHRTYPHATILTTDRKTAAALAYYVSPKPVPVVKWNPNGHIDDHFELEHDFAKVADRPTILVTTNNPQDMIHYFHMALPLGMYDIPLSTGKSRRYAIYYLEGYKQFGTS